MKRLTQKIIKVMNLLAIAIFAMAGNSLAQNAATKKSFAEILKPESSERWLRFREGTQIDPSTFFTDYKDALGLSDFDNMQLKEVKNDELGFNHYNFNQYYKNLRVVFGEFKLHQTATGFVKSANGRLIKGINTTNIPVLTEQQALQVALNFMNAKKYLWENEMLEAELKRIENNPNATHYPTGELVLAPTNFNCTYLGKEYNLAWAFKIYTDDLNVEAKTVYVDALTGEIKYHTPLSMVCSGATGTSAFNGTVSFSTEYTGSTYRSHNDCQTTDLYVYNCNGGAAATTYYNDADNTWTGQSAVQCQWGTLWTYNYFNGAHSRQSWNGASGDMISYNNAYAGSNNACWGCTGNQAIFYAGSTSAATDDWNTNDIVGHEFAHGVTQDEAGLVYSYESGALNESFSDVFGEMVESYSEGNCDYLIGGDRGAIRNMANPNDYGDPDTYLGTNWYVGSGDNGGVHTNSGVQNFWFYLLSEGGSGTNDNGLAYSVSGITRFTARAIAYRALVLYLSGSDGYIDARAASLEAAYDLYGGCSNEIIQVGRAWRAVGVESQSAQYVNNACGNYPASGTFAQAISQLTAASGCAVNITASATTVYFSATDRVILYPGFTAVSGSKFYAYLEPCAITMWKPDYDATMSDAEKGFIAKEQGIDESTASNSLASTVSALPNPFENTLTVNFKLDENASVRIRMFNAVGQVVKDLSNYGSLQAGGYNLTYETHDLEHGIYFLNVEINNKKEIIKVVKL